MKKITLLLLLPILFSCQKNKEEQMFYDYQKKQVLKINFNIDDLDLKIKSVTKINEIKAKDSMFFFKNKLNEYYKGTKKDSELITFENAISELDTLINSYQELILLRAKAGKSYLNYEDRESRNKFTKEKVYLENWKYQYDNYNKNPDKILSVKYKIEYTILNPLLNNSKQTFAKYIFTDSKQTQFLKEENIEKL